MSLILALCLLAHAEEPVTSDPAPDDDEIPTVIVKQPDGTPRVAGSAHVIDAEELDTYAYDDIGRVLSQTPGVYIRGEDGYGLRPNIGMRGANSDRSAKVTLLEDGVPLVPAPYAAPAAYYFPMSRRMTGVEVFKGAASTQYGPQTVGGALNLLTRPVPQDGPHGALDLAAGLRQTVRLHGWAGTGNERGGVLAEVEHLGTAGFKELDNGGPTGFERTDVMLKARLASDPTKTTRNALTLKLGWGHERSYETYLGLHPDDFAVDPDRRYAASANALMRWNRTQAELAWKLDVGAVQVRTTAYHHWLARSWGKLNGFEDSRDIHALVQQPDAGTASDYLDILRGELDTDVGRRLRLGTNAREYHAFGVDSRARWVTRGDGFRSQLEFGVRFHGDLVDRRHSEVLHDMRDGTLVKAGDEEVTLDSHATAFAVALHAHEDLALGGLHLLPGVRTEIVHTTYAYNDEPAEDTGGEGGGLASDDWRTTVLPGFAALVEATDSIQVYGGVHRGYSPVAPGQPEEIKPESSVNVEAGLRGGNNVLHGELTGYFNHYDNLTGQCTLSGGCTEEQIDQQFNGGKAWVYGAEAAGGLEARLPNGMRIPVSATYTLSMSSFRTGFISGFPQFGAVAVGDHLPYVPVHQAGLRVGLDMERLRLAVGLSTRSGMRDHAGQGPLTETDVPAQALLDVAAHVPLDDVLEGYVTVNNLLDTRTIESWRPFGARPTPPRQVMLGIRASR